MEFRRRIRQGASGRTAGEWQRRPFLSASLRVLVFVGPILASLAISLLLSHFLPRATDALTAILWILVVAAGSLLTLFILERAARRLLPLAALLNVSMVFPDEAPKRFAVARQTGSPRDLQSRLRQARATGRVADAEGMQGVVELVLALSVHDKGTRGHSERVRVFTDLIADELRIDEAGKARLRWAALLHDVGKLEVPVRILNKPEKPDAAEWQVLHRHPEQGARMVAALMPWLGEWGQAVAQHHERWDGTGYPRGLKGEQISLAARIVSVADTYEVMTAPRPYKRAMSVAASRRELTRVAGTQLDPHIVRAFLNVSAGRLWRTIGFAAWLGQIPSLARLVDGLTNLGATAGSGAATVAAAGMIAVGSLAPAALVPNTHSHAATPPATSSPASPKATPGVLPPASAPRPHPSTPAPRSFGSTASAQPATPAPADPAPSATPAATPAPTPPQAGPCLPGSSSDPCSDTSAGCLHYCNNSHNSLSACTNHCEVNNSAVCTSYCYGSNNAACLDKCYAHNGSCVSNCAQTSVLAALIAGARDTGWVRTR